MEDKAVLVVGGGKIAGDKIEKLLDFTKKITVIAPKVDERVANFIASHNLTYHERSYQKGDIEGFFLVIVAVDDLDLQRSIFEEAQDKKILVNAVDSVEYCEFIFPSYIKEGDLIIAFSTSGASPSLAKYLRRAIQRLLPPDIGQFVAKLKELRQTLPKGKERMELLDQKAKEYIDKHFRSSDV